MPIVRNCGGQHPDFSLRKVIKSLGHEITKQGMVEWNRWWQNLNANENEVAMGEMKNVLHSKVMIWFCNLPPQEGNKIKNLLRCNSLYSILWLKEKNSVFYNVTVSFQSTKSKIQVLTLESAEIFFYYYYIKQPEGQYFKSTLALPFLFVVHCCTWTWTLKMLFFFRKLVYNQLCNELNLISFCLSWAQISKI